MRMKRLESLREAMAEKGLDAFFLGQRENILYLTGFSGSTAGLYVTEENAFLLVDSRYEEQAKAECPDADVVLVSRPYEIGKIADGEKRVGFEEDVLTYEVYHLLRDEAADAEFVPAAALPRQLRTIKDEDELVQIETAVKIADSAFHHILPFIKEGVYEIDIANELDFYMRKQGAGGPSFDFIVAGGERSSLPHGVAGKNKLKAHEPVLMDYGCVYQHYCSDMTRTVFLGDPGEEARALYQIVKEGQKRGHANCLCGKPISFAETAVRSYFSSCEVESFFGHSLGHGVGLEIHEAPAVNAKNEERFRNGMVYTVEPGVYIPGACGVRIEDMAVMTYQGPRILTESPKELIIL
ncbi:MAG: M24 family metallopeptidase [Bacillota bacterium]|jgi:Xaa-Pro aminopeptidase